ncbi:hypothetical protein [Streptomyces sp. 8N706]|uniref:hypothetical protein n=1 Tax=Streptomyces sp. 8N706 TaxID=3457416 RepID=UPI003FCF4CC7
MSGRTPEAGLPFKSASGKWQVNTITPTLRNTVTDADGDKVNLTFEVWTAKADGTPGTKVKLTDDNEYGVLVSPYVNSGQKAQVKVPAGRLKNNTTYMFHTNAYDGSLYETTWSPWATFTVRAGIDLTLPALDSTSPNPNQTIQKPSSSPEKPLVVNTSSLSAQPDSDSDSDSGKEQCGPVGKDGAQVCFGKPVPADKGPKMPSTLAPPQPGGAAGVADWCDDDLTLVRATRTLVCENRKVPAYYRKDGQVQATAWFLFQRLISLDGVNSFSETLTVKPISIPADFYRIQLGIYQHLCEDGCDPVEADPSAWKGKPDWTAGDTHIAYITSSYLWDDSTADKQYTFKPDVQINGIIDPVGEETIQTIGYQWSLGGVSDFDEVRCDTKAQSTKAGCVIPAYAPTYTFNAGKNPQAAAHAWLIQQATPKTPGVQSAGTPLYYLPGGRDGKNRAVICDEDGWAKNNHDPDAMNSSTDTPDCDEFTFNATYNSGGMPANLGGLNPVSSGAKCIQSYATKVDGKIHLRNLPGALTTFKEVCGRSAMSGSQNRGSMGAFSAGFVNNMRLMDKDAYWLETNITGSCTSANSDAWRCTMTLK